MKQTIKWNTKTTTQINKTTNYNMKKTKKIPIYMSKILMKLQELTTTKTLTTTTLKSFKIPNKS